MPLKRILGWEGWFTPAGFSDDRRQLRAGLNHPSQPNIPLSGFSLTSFMKSRITDHVSRITHHASRFTHQLVLLAHQLRDML